MALYVMCGEGIHASATRSVYGGAPTSPSGGRTGVVRKCGAMVCIGADDAQAGTREIDCLVG